MHAAGFPRAAAATFAVPAGAAPLEGAIGRLSAKAGQAAQAPRIDGVGGTDSASVNRDGAWAPSSAIRAAQPNIARLSSALADGPLDGTRAAQGCTGATDETGVNLPNMHGVPEDQEADLLALVRKIVALCARP